MMRFLLPLAALCGGCAHTVEFASQDITIHSPEDKDRLELTLVYEGVQPSGPAENALRWLGKVKAKERQFFLGFMPYSFDFEDAEERDEDEATKLIARSLEVTDVALAVDEEGQLCLRQAIVWKDFSKVLDAMNLMLDDAMREGLEVEDEDKQFAETTFEMVELYLAEGTRILSLTDEAFEMRVPMGREDLRKSMRELDAQDLDDIRDFLMAGEVKYSDAKGLHVRWLFDKERNLVLRYEKEIERKDAKWRESLGELPKREF